MSEGGKNLSELYESTTEMFKHFNSLIDKVRIIIVSSGIIVYAACGKIFLSYNEFSSNENGNHISENNFWLWLILGISVWGILFVIMMWYLAKHYLAHTESIAEAARSIEKEILNEHKLSLGAFGQIFKDHHGNKGKLKGKRKFFYDFGTFFAIGVGYLGLILIALFLLIFS